MKKIYYTSLILFFLQLSKIVNAQVPTTWTVNAASYQYQMTMTCKANQACVDLKNSNNYIAAFVGSQCRGIIQTSTAAGTNSLGLLTVNSNSVSGEIVKFKVYNSVTNTVLVILDSVVFNQGAQLGTIGNPFRLYTNHPPSNLSISNYTVTEYSPLAMPIATISATDQDGTTTFNYSLTLGQSENTQFTVNANQLLVNSIFDYSMDSLKTIELLVDDNNGCSVTKTFTIHIMNINQAPTDITIDTTSLFENNDIMFYISKIRSIDIDYPKIFTYSFVSGLGSDDNAMFTIVNDKLYINDKTIYVAKNSYRIRVKTTDAGNLSFEKSFEISIIDIVGNSITLPSANYISPNKDGKNDYWKVDNVEIFKDFSLQIFDQFGQVIYYVPNNYNNEFDGTYKGNALPTGNYYFVFKNDKKTFKGNIAIVN